MPKVKADLNFNGQARIRNHPPAEQPGDLAILQDVEGAIATVEQKVTNLEAKNKRIVTSNSTFYISPAGNNNNLGTQLSPWKTLPYALSQISQNYRLVEAQAIIQCLDGIYDIEPFFFPDFFDIVSSSVSPCNIVILGNNSNKNAVVFRRSKPGFRIIDTNLTNVDICFKSIKFIGNNSNEAFIFARGSGLVELDSCTIEGSNRAWVIALNHGYFVDRGTNYISNFTGQSIFWADTLSNSSVRNNLVIESGATVSLSRAFFVSDFYSKLNLTGLIITNNGTVSGKKYSVDQSYIVRENNNDDSFIPGTLPGELLGDSRFGSITYSNSASGLTATNKQQAIDETIAKVNNNQTRLDAAIASVSASLNSLFGSVAQINQQLAITTYGEEALLDPAFPNLVLARQLRFEGLGVSNNKVNGYLRRFNGMEISNTTGMLFNLGAVITSAEFTCNDNFQGRTIQFRHYNLSGGDEKIAGEFQVNLENNQFGFISNAKIFIPARRRFAPWMQGDRFSSPQLRLSYRRVLDTI